MSELVANQISAYLKAEYPHLTAVFLHPGFVRTDMTFDALEPFSKDTPDLVRRGSMAQYHGQEALKWKSYYRELRR